MTKHEEEELKAKAEEITKEIATVLKRHSPQPGIVFLAALSASLKLLADSIEKGGGPSAEETMNVFSNIQRRASPLSTKTTHNMRKQYYIDSPFWRKINTRTEALGEFLAGFKHTLVEFNDERTPHITKEDLLAFIELHVSNINERIGRGRKLTVRMGEFVGDIIYSFEFEGKSDGIGNLRLKPILKTIGCADDVEGKEAEND